MCRDRFIHLIRFGGKTQFGLMCVCVVRMGGCDLGRTGIGWFRLRCYVYLGLFWDDIGSTVRR